MLRSIQYDYEALVRSIPNSRAGLSVGKHTYGKPRIMKFAGDRARVSIGRYCSIAQKVLVFVGGNHRIDWISTYPLRVMKHLPGRYEDGHPATRGDVCIGNDVWLGYACTIMSGVRISDGAVVAAHALVVDDVPPYAIVGGNPARLIRSRFQPQQIEALLRIVWWEWDESQVIANAPLLSSTLVDDFIAMHDRAGADENSLRRQANACGAPFS